MQLQHDAEGSIADSYSGLSPEEEAAKDRQLIEALECNDFEAFRNVRTIASDVPPPPYEAPRQFLPCIVPQAFDSWDHTYTCPFIRAYPPNLQSKGISEEKFLRFLDGFNETFGTASASESSSFGGLIVSQLQGRESFDLTTMGARATAWMSGGNMAHFRSREYVKAANETLFHPSGVTCSISTTLKMLDKVGCRGKQAEMLQLPIYLNDAESEQSNGAGAQAMGQRLQGLQDYIQPLRIIDTPGLPRGESTRSSDSFHRSESNASLSSHRSLDTKLEKIRGKVERKVRKQELKLDRKQMKMDTKVRDLEKELHDCSLTRRRQLSSPSAQTSPLLQRQIEVGYQAQSAAIQEKVMEKSAKRAEKIAKAKEKIAKAEGKVGIRSERAVRKEQKRAQKVRWIVISEYKPEARHTQGEHSDYWESDSESEVSLQSTGRSGTERALSIQSSH